ncbi:hypothetical protein PanWU01x14_229200 [Parasponia andersonii]|uniref:Uncharacterized protein n=1 Tax=Parasponia andersonii TaxID=3476 RepID=A0A2P5BLF9_PARAD|nr:hypothetical protein PanWU01x14_229200 [Parasponia andersonii]
MSEFMGLAISPGLRFQFNDSPLPFWGQCIMLSSMFTSRWQQLKLSANYLELAKRYLNAINSD